MAFSVTTLQPVSTPPPSATNNENTAAASLLSMLILSVYAANHSKKAVRKLRRRFLWTAFKLKVKSMFSRKKAVSDRQLIIYILIGILALVLVFYAPIAALIIALVALILILTGTI